MVTGAEQVPPAGGTGSRVKDINQVPQPLDTLVENQGTKRRVDDLAPDEQVLPNGRQPGFEKSKWSEVKSQFYQKAEKGSFGYYTIVVDSEHEKDIRDQQFNENHSKQLIDINGKLEFVEDRIYDFTRTGVEGTPYFDVSAYLDPEMSEWEKVPNLDKTSDEEYFLGRIYRVTSMGWLPDDKSESPVTPIDSSGDDVFRHAVDQSTA